MIERNKSLKEYNTFALDCTATEYMEFRNLEDLEQIGERYRQGGRFVVLGGGSNTVFSQTSLEACVLRICNKGIEVLEEDSERIKLRVAAGEVWSDFVKWCCERNYCGLENLAAIYGTVGAAPVQNIGAYGAQVADFVQWVECYDMAKGCFIKVEARDCEFAYRFSRWKHSHRNELICFVVFSLQKTFTPQLSYAAVARIVEQTQSKNLSASRMCELITQVRNSKLPDVKTLGNVGSFFKNPTVTKAKAEELKAKDERLVTFEEADGVKLAAGYLIEQCGFKGKRFGNVGMHATQALVLVNYGGASGEEILQFANHVIDTVGQTYGVRLEIEAHVV